MSFKRFPIIRHFRFLVALYQYNKWWKGYAHHIWLTPNPADLQYLRDILDGKR